MKNPKLFQGEKYIKNKKSYFEGWYFKNTNNKNGISFIPGINVNEQEKKAFIQIITNNSSFYVDYCIDEFKFSFEPFYIKIGNCYFSENEIHIDINDTIQNLIIYGDIKYANSKNITTNFLSPNIMGLFSYIPFMECNHAILNMKNKVDGFITINNDEIIFDNGIGYIEKDWGCSFPKSYIWCQANNFINSNVSLMLSIADIPFKFFHFKGIICSLIVDDFEYRFATYNNTKLIKYDVNNNSLDIILKKNHYFLNVKSDYSNGLKLVAPVKGRMKKNIFESISTTVTVTLKKDDIIIFSGTSMNCGLEIVPQ